MIYKQVKPSELVGPALDWAVAKCEEPSGRDNAKTWLRDYLIGFSTRYSSSWSQGGMIIEREKIGIWPSERADKESYWGARMMNTYICYGPTPLIAAMRCLVAFKLGDTVEIPEELA